MTAAALSQRKRSFSGYRPVNPRKDMGAIADLIQEAFNQEMDPIGSRLVREMKIFSRGGIFGWLLGRIFLPQAAYPMGYVWEEDGRVVGNASLLRVEGFPFRWVMANVAVASAHRGKGIGKALIQASIELAQKRNARELLLQVLSLNQVAQVLYASLGFHPLSTRTTWIRARHERMTVEAEPSDVRPRASGEWKDQLALAERLHPEGLVWPYPLTSTLFHLSGLSSFFYQELYQHWVWYEGERLMGSLTTRQSTERSTLRLILMVSPEMRGKIETSLITCALKSRPNRRIQYILDYPAGVAEENLKTLGFQAQRTLTWMSKELLEPKG
jgi:GNAT superfamily N-acetyltransferase